MSSTCFTPVEFCWYSDWDRVAGFNFDRFAEIRGGDTIRSATVTCTPSSGITISAPAISPAGDKVQVRISDASAGDYELLCHAVLASGYDISQKGKLHVEGV